MFVSILMFTSFSVFIYFFTFYTIDKTGKFVFIFLLIPIPSHCLRFKLFEGVSCSCDMAMAFYFRVLLFFFCLFYSFFQHHFWIYVIFAEENICVSIKKLAVIWKGSHIWIADMKKVATKIPWKKVQTKTRFQLIILLTARYPFFVL